MTLVETKKIWYWLEQWQEWQGKATVKNYIWLDFSSCEAAEMERPVGVFSYNWKLNKDELEGSLSQLTVVVNDELSKE